MSLTKFTDEVQGRLNAATPGPWKCDDDGDVYSKVKDSIGTTRFFVEGNPDGQFIAHARTDVEKLLKIIEMQREALEESKTHFNSIMSGLITDINMVEQMTKRLAHDASLQVMAALELSDKIAGGE